MEMMWKEDIIPSKTLLITFRFNRVCILCNVSNKCVFFSSTWEDCAIQCMNNRVGLKIKCKDYLINFVEEYFK